MAFSTEGSAAAALFLVAGHESNPNEGSIFVQNAFGGSRDFLRQNDLEWFSDITALRDGSLLVWYAQCGNLRIFPITRLRFYVKSILVHLNCRIDFTENMSCRKISKFPQCGKMMIATMVHFVL